MSFQQVTDAEEGKTVTKLPSINYIRTHGLSANGIKHLAVSCKDLILREIPGFKFLLNMVSGRWGRDLSKTAVKGSVLGQTVVLTLLARPLPPLYPQSRKLCFSKTLKMRSWFFKKTTGFFKSQPGSLCQTITAYSLNTSLVSLEQMGDYVSQESVFWNWQKMN